MQGEAVAVIFKIAHPHTQRGGQVAVLRLEQVMGVLLGLLIILDMPLAAAVQEETLVEMLLVALTVLGGQQLPRKTLGFTAFNH